MLEGHPSERQMLLNVPSGTVTFLFTDIEGSTRLLESLREQYAILLNDQRRILQTALARWNGHEIDTQGDSFFIAFARAMDAVRCVMEVQHSLAKHTWPQGVQLRVRMGLHTGEPLLSQIESGSSEETQGNEDKSHPYYIGMDVHRAARIASTGHGGQVLLSETTRDLIYQDLPEGASLRDLGSHELKDIRYPQRIYQLVIEGLPSEFPPLKTLSAQTESLTLDIRLQTTAPPGENEVEAYESLLKRWRAQGRQALDKASLAILLGAPPEMTFEQDDLTWLLRGALQNELELEPWVKRASSPVDATHTLELLLREYPRPQARLAIVEALCTLDNEQATEVLLQVAASDDSIPVRTRAAQEAARRGRMSDVVRRLADEASKDDNPAAVAALVAVIDEYGVPPRELGDYPKLPVAIGLAQRRWLKKREAVVRQSVRGATGGGLALAVLGCSFPLLTLLIYPEMFESNRQFVSEAAWVMSGAIVGLVWGGLQGLASGAAVGLADVLWPVRRPSAWRFVFAGMAGMVYSILLILFASARLLSPPSGSQVFIPVFLAYGFLQGGALSWVIPRLGTTLPGRVLAPKVLQTSLFIGLVALPSIYLVYQDQFLARLPIDWLYALLLPAGLALATNRKLGSQRISPAKDGRQ